MDQTANHHLKPTSPTSHRGDGATVTSLVDRMSANLLDPLTFDEIESLRFRKLNVCGSCGSPLLRDFIPGGGARKWIMVCPAHGDIHEGEYVTSRQWARSQQGTRSGMMEFWR